MSSGDPFTLMHRGVWYALMGHPPLAALVRANNRLNVIADGVSDPFAKAEVSTADLPEIEVLPGEWTCQDHQGKYGNTSSLPITQTFNIVIRTDKLNAAHDAGINAIKWEVYRALVKYRHKSAGTPNVTYSWPDSGRDAVGVRGGTEDGRGGVDPATGLRGWHCLMQMRVTVYLSHDIIGIGHTTGNT